MALSHPARLHMQPHRQNAHLERSSAFSFSLIKSARGTEADWEESVEELTAPSCRLNRCLCNVRDPFRQKQINSVIVFLIKKLLNMTLQPEDSLHEDKRVIQSSLS